MTQNQKYGHPPRWRGGMGVSGIPIQSCPPPRSPRSPGLSQRQNSLAQEEGEGVISLQTPGPQNNVIICGDSFFFHVVIQMY